MDRGGRPQPAATGGADLIVPAAAVALAAYYIASTADLTWEARSTGTLVGGALLVLCTLQACAVLYRRRQGIALGFGGLFSPTATNRQRTALLAVLCVFVGTLPWVGTTLGLFLSLVSGMAILGVRDLRRMLAVAAATSMTVFLLFMLLLKSRLPKGAVDERLLSFLAGAGS